MKDDIAKLVKDLPQRAENAHATSTSWTRQLYSVTSEDLHRLALQPGRPDQHRRPGRRGRQGFGYPQLSQEFIVKANPDFDLPGRRQVLPAVADTVKAAQPAGPASPR